MLDKKFYPEDITVEDFKLMTEYEEVRSACSLEMNAAYLTLVILRLEDWIYMLSPSEFLPVKDDFDILHDKLLSHENKDLITALSYLMIMETKKLHYLEGEPSVCLKTLEETLDQVIDMLNRAADEKS